MSSSIPKACAIIQRLSCTVTDEMSFCCTNVFVDVLCGRCKGVQALRDVPGSRVSAVGSQWCIHIPIREDGREYCVFGELETRLLPMFVAAVRNVHHITPSLQRPPKRTLRTHCYSFVENLLCSSPLTR